MPEPTASFQLFSWLRQGLLAGMTNSASTAPATDGRLVLPIRLRVNNAAGFDVPVQIYGPGDITGLDAREVIRTDPQHLMSDFEPNYFPLIEFDRPDFPWLFSPAMPDAAKRLRPWICLIVVPKEGATISASPNGPLPVLECSLRELPNLDQSWAWAHTQIMSGSTGIPDPPRHEGLKQILKQHPERTLSRLLGARRLDPNTAYYACLVPTYEIGRKAGLGEAITQEEEQALAPAWASIAEGQTDASLKLPVYFHWEFRTGSAGDFESLTRRLEPQPLPDTVGLRPLDISAPGWGMPRLAPDAPGAILDMGGALRTPDTRAQAWPATAKTSFQQALRTILNLPATHDTSATRPTVLGPPLYGQWYAKQQTVTAAQGAPNWFNELNLDPRLRVAAGLGTLVVRYEQEQLMASAWDQLAKQVQDIQRIKRAQLAEVVNNGLSEKHMASLGPAQLLRLTSPAHAAINRAMQKDIQSVQAMQLPNGNPALSGAFRRLSRSRGPLAKRMERTRSMPIGGGVAAAQARRDIASAISAAGLALAKRGSGEGSVRSLQTLKTNLLNRLDPKVTVLNAVRKTDPAVESTDLIRFAPEFPQPMYELIRDYFHGMLLPGIEQVPNNAIALLETNQAFVEAFMVGLNHEMSRELLWRGYPTDQRGTYFRQFWDVRGNAQALDERQREPLKDITRIADWADDSHLGEHAVRNTADGQMVLLIKGDLLRRYPRAMVYAVQAVWSADGTRRELGTVELYPAFRATQGMDITMLGFLLTEAQVRGADDSTNSGDAGWFFVLQEQPTEPRFGMDVATIYGGTPQHWRDLTWGNLAASEDALKLMTYVPLDGLLKDANVDNIPWGKNSAHMASITRQRPFRVAIHARTWLSPKGKVAKPEDEGAMPAKGEVTVPFLEQEGVRLRAEVEAAIQQVNARQQELAAAQTRATAAQASVTNAQSQLTALAASAAAADGVLTEAERRLAAHWAIEPESVLEGEDGRKPRPNPAWRIWKRELDRLTTQRDQAQGEAAAAHGRLSSGQAAVAQAQAQQQAAENAVTAATAALQTAQAANTAAQQRLADWELGKTEIARDPLDRTALEQVAAKLAAKTLALEESHTLARFKQEDAEAHLAALDAERKRLTDLLDWINGGLPPVQTDLQRDQAAFDRASTALSDFLNTGT